MSLSRCEVVRLAISLICSHGEQLETVDIAPPMAIGIIKRLLTTGFQTDADISGNRGGERELKPWADEGDLGAGPNGAGPGGAGARPADRGDTITFGGPVNSTPWDQFETNERLFGAKTDYDEELYTTKLDRSTTGYKRREREADRLAQDIMSVSLSRSCFRTTLTYRKPRATPTLQRSVVK